LSYLGQPLILHYFPLHANVCTIILLEYRDASKNKMLLGDGII